MIAFLLPLMASAGVPQRLQKAAAWLVAILAGIVIAALIVWAFFHWLGQREVQAVKLNRAEVNAEANARITNAYEAADANAQDRAANDAANDKELSHAATKGDDRAVGPGVISVLDSMRRQQAAGRR